MAQATQAGSADSPPAPHRTLAEREADVIDDDLGVPGGIPLGRIPSHESTARSLGRHSSCRSCDVSAQTLTPDDGKRPVQKGDVEKLEDVKGYMLTQEGDYIWVRPCLPGRASQGSHFDSPLQVDFAPDSHADPMSFKPWRKWAITIVAIMFTFWTSYK